MIMIACITEARHLERALCLYLWQKIVLCRGVCPAKSSARPSVITRLHTYLPGLERFGSLSLDLLLRLAREQYPTANPQISDVQIVERLKAPGLASHLVVDLACGYMFLVPGVTAGRRMVSCIDIQEIHGSLLSPGDGRVQNASIHVVDPPRLCFVCQRIGYFLGSVMFGNICGSEFMPAFQQDWTRIVDVGFYQAQFLVAPRLVAQPSGSHP
jgi:hypothetical protein